MNLRDYLKSLPRGGGAELARALGKPHVYLCQIAAGIRRANPGLSLAIERATNGAVTARELRPDLAEIFGPTKEGAAA